MSTFYSNPVAAAAAADSSKLYRIFSLLWEINKPRKLTAEDFLFRTKHQNKLTLKMSTHNNSDLDRPRGNIDLEAPEKTLFGIGTDNFVTLLIFGLIFTLGVLGNSLVITVLAQRKPGQQRSTTNIFILNLSVADLSYLLFCIPFQSTVYMLPTWILGAFICKFIHYFFTVSMLVSIFTLSAMSVDRYIAIVHCRKSSSIRVARHALIGVLVIWVLSFAMATPVAYYQGIVESEDNSTFCWEVWPDHGRRKIYVVCTFVFGYVLPLILISFCYAKVGDLPLTLAWLCEVLWLSSLFMLNKMWIVYYLLNESLQNKDAQIIGKQEFYYFFFFLRNNLCIYV